MGDRLEAATFPCIYLDRRWAGFIPEIRGFFRVVSRSTLQPRRVL